ncbi:putative 2-pyrone-4,6-dicarboxylic acid hydrolase [Pseudomonas sp. FEN]|nr:putative 2-pyrone-4,6-dicarboxylic acid hydrolase [Pseudomonas sp. FEN]
MSETCPLPIRGIDAHAHVFQRGLGLAAVRRYAPDYDAPWPITWRACGKTT